MNLLSRILRRETETLPPAAEVIGYVNGGQDLVAKTLLERAKQLDLHRMAVTEHEERVEVVATLASIKLSLAAALKTRAALHDKMLVAEREGRVNDHHFHRGQIATLDWIEKHAGS